MEFITNKDHLKLESVRLDTFHTWPFDSVVSKDEAARQGFYYRGHGDTISCAFCQGYLNDWKLHDVVSVEHSKWFPLCPFVQGRECGNKPFLHANIRFPSYIIFYDRMDSFNGDPWTKDGNLSPDRMASAGLFFVGPRDTVQCFSCGVKLDRWQPDDDCWSEHKKFSPYCSFLLERFGCWFSVDGSRISAQKGQQNVSQTSNTLCYPQQESTSMQEDMPFSEQGIYRNLENLSLVVQSAPGSVSSLVVGSKSSSAPSSMSSSRPAQMLSSRPHQMSQRIAVQESQPALVQESQPALVQESQPALVQESQAGSVQESQPASDQMSQASSSQISNSAMLGESQTVSKKTNDLSRKEIEELLQKVENLENANLCKICFENNVEIVFVPCKHWVCCSECSSMQNLCPICRRPILQRERIYRA